MKDQKVTENDPWAAATVFGKAGKASTGTKYWYNVEDRELGVQKV